MQNAHSNWVVQAHDLSLTFPGATKSAPPVQALRHIDMQVPAGQIVGWLGPDITTNHHLWQDVHD